MLQVNQSQENWSDVQLSLSTATPSLGGALPKLATLKIGYEVPRYNYDYDRVGCASVQLKSASFMSRKALPMMRMRAQTSLGSSVRSDGEDDKSSELVNVLATETEASMSSASFNIPRRATIDADVSLLFLYSISSFSSRVNHTKSRSVYLI